MENICCWCNFTDEEKQEFADFIVAENVNLNDKG